MTGKLKNLRVAYMGDEDRLLLSFETELGGELRFWLTRRMAKSLLGAADRRLDEAAAASLGNTTGEAGIADPTRARAVRNFEESAAIGAAPIKAEVLREPVKPEANRDAVFVRRAAFQPRPDGTFALLLSDSQGKGMGFNLPREHVLRFRHMMIRAADRGGWDLVFETQASEPTPPPEAGRFN